jgi:hypothetical protein
MWDFDNADTRDGHAALRLADDHGHGICDGIEFTGSHHTQPSRESNLGHGFDLERIGARVLSQTILWARWDSHKPSMSRVRLFPVGERDHNS